jgi:hypothetical protein
MTHHHNTAHGHPRKPDLDKMLPDKTALAGNITTPDVATGDRQLATIRLQRVRLFQIDFVAVNI